MASANTTKPPNEQRQCAFLNLPFEVRYQIYGDMASLSTTIFGSYRGLYLSCKVIQDEMAQKSERQIRKTLDAFVHASRLISNPPAHLLLASSLHYMRNVTLDISLQYFQAYTCSSNAANLRALCNYAPLFRLHLDSITIKTNSRALLFGQTRHQLSQMTLPQMLALTGLDSNSPPNTRRIRYKFNFDKPDYFERFMTARLRGWRPWTDWHQGLATQIVWVKNVEGEEEQNYEWMQRHLRPGLVDWWTRRHDLSARERMEAKMDAAYKGGRRHEPFGSVMSNQGRVYVQEAINSGILPASLARGLRQQ